ncbi:MAG TPA: flagellar basal body P-ring formation chaperone FlgA [Candidatus Baltobacteraceae bacterium]|nr:flagellar basal body P-ring formation chaperone FlgA [Candidatus Baltobacteraceae bacterium]
MRSAAFAFALVLSLAPALAGAQGEVLHVSGERIALAASREIARLTHDADHEYVAVSVVPDQVLTGDSVSLHAESPVGSPSFVNVPVTIDVDGKLDRTVYVGYRMQQYVETAVAAHDIVPGTVLSEDDLTMARVPFTGRAANGIDALVGRKTLETVLKGQPMTIADTSVNQIVKAGSTVVLIVRDNGVQVTADVIARTSGGLGDQVSVYNPSTNKALSGTVTAPGTVVLDISGGDE